MVAPGSESLVSIIVYSPSVSVIAENTIEVSLEKINFTDAY